MSDPRRAAQESPLDALPTPDQLTARVVDPGPPPRLLGYDVEGDLARHYGFAELLLLAGSGDLASPAAARALELALIFLSPISVAEAPAHAGLLARLCDVPAQGRLAIGALALAEEAAFVLREHAAWLDWLGAPEAARGPAPEPFLAASEDERASVARLRSALEAIPFRVSALDLEVQPTRTAALLAVLITSGLPVAFIPVAWTIARLPALAAESASAHRLAFHRYPINLPPLDYEEEP